MTISKEAYRVLSIVERLMHTIAYVGYLVFTWTGHHGLDHSSFRLWYYGIFLASAI